MTLRKLASEIARREGRRSQARIGDIRESLAVLCDIIFEAEEESADLLQMLYDNGKKRAKRKKK